MHWFAYDDDTERYEVKVTGKSHTFAVMSSQDVECILAAVHYLNGGSNVSINQMINWINDKTLKVE